jgi:hypothetical protein
MDTDFDAFDDGFGVPEDIIYDAEPSLDNEEDNKTDDKIETNNTETSANILVSIKNMFPDRSSHLKSLVSIYRFINAVNVSSGKALYEKTKADLISDVMDASYSIDVEKMLAEHDKDTVLQLKKDRVLYKQVAAIPAFLDFAYIYYVQHYNNSAPIYKLPVFLQKLKLIMTALKAPYDKLAVCFEQCIENKTISSMRIETPPYHMRIDLTKEQIREQIRQEVLPVLKNILNLCLKLDKPDKPDTLKLDNPSIVDVTETVTENVTESSTVPNTEPVEVEVKLNTPSLDQFTIGPQGDFYAGEASMNVSLPTPDL